MSKPKIDLTLLKRLVTELESSLNTVESLKTDVTNNGHEVVVEASKAIGLASGVMQEAGAIIMDIGFLLEGEPAPKSQAEFLQKLLGSLKGPGNSN